MQRMYDYQPNNQRAYRNDFNRQQERRTIQSRRCCVQPQGTFPECTPVAMAFIPFQEMNEIYDERKAFERGTVFPCLDKPFLGGSCKC